MSDTLRDKIVAAELHLAAGLYDSVFSDLEDALTILDASDWCLDGWQNDTIPYREVHDPGTFPGA